MQGATKKKHTSTTTRHVITNWLDNIENTLTKEMKPCTDLINRIDELEDLANTQRHYINLLKTQIKNLLDSEPV